MTNTSLISVVVPAMNEEENVQPFYDAVTAVTDELSEYDWEFIFVDDGSTDQTLPRIQALREKDARVHALQLSRNFGSYAALRAGFDYAHGDAVITISADLQDPPMLFRPFLERWQQGYHTVWGVREQRDDGWGKKLLASMFYRLIRRLALAYLPTGGMDCGLFDRKVINAFRQIPDRNSITFMTIYWMGFRQARIPYHRQRRRLGTSKWPIGKRAKAAVDVITLFSYLPIRLCTYIGLAVSTISILGALLILLNKIMWGIGGWGWPSVMVALLFLGGVQLIMLGTIGEYLWRISSEVRGQPQYIIMTEIGFGNDSPQFIPPLTIDHQSPVWKDNM